MTGKGHTLRRRVLILGATGAIVTLGLCVLFHRPIVSHVVTALAFRDAERLAAEIRGRSEGEFDQAMERAIETIQSRYGYLLSRGFFNRWEVIRLLPTSGVTEEAVPAMIVIGGFYASNEERMRVSRPDKLDIVASEFAEWLDPVASLPGPKELLANIFVTSLSYFPGAERGDGIVKLALFSSLFCEGETDIFDCPSKDNLSPVKARLVGLVGPDHWLSVIRHTEHEREMVRAGSLLLLNRHPSEKVIVERARMALDDPSDWVRLAGAGLLAVRGIDAGHDVLLEGIEHERWEVRYWCVFGLFHLARPGLVEILEKRLAAEKDAWLKEVLGHAIEKLKERPG